MKYVITENRMEGIIKDYLLKNPDIIDVDFETIRVYLVSKPNEKGENSMEQRQIIVYLDNIRNTKGYRALKEIRDTIKSSLEGLFNLEFDKYGSEWRLVVYQVKRELI